MYYTYYTYTGRYTWYLIQYTCILFDWYVLRILGFENSAAIVFKPSTPQFIVLYCHLDFAIMCAIVGDMIFPSCYVCFPCPCKRNTILQDNIIAILLHKHASSGLTYLNPPPPPSHPSPPQSYCSNHIFIFMFTFTHNSQVKM